ncbi:MGMT family protein [Dickeya solani]|uniref:MGMT family protein n=2 Tax=Dickeya solani TaxID=1089444 RepID=A0AAP7B8T3_9GAMM|nr:MGMT family protein [Dickeya solani]ANE76457.1 methyltransferase [Dickeya solani IPO 2222]AUH08132.1 methyltransferase [Dickeya solani D s0432-1]AUH12146.1 methyltransferase [Dickeya solani]AYQ46949.1 Methylated-DNA--protein-cysteine methyltransferase [Dickeya solani]AYQ51121.1 Methylated-DNA--protein-cysteine methyltransferase [Dickeya solani]
MITEADNFRQRVIHVIAAIPYGCVVTYGDVARLAGSARAARQVGGILRGLPAGSLLPWYRVINRKGEISLTGSDFQRQKSALQSEGVILNPEGKIDLERFRWRYVQDLL